VYTLAGMALGVFVILMLGILVGAFLLEFFFLRNLRDLLNQVSYDNRKMEPGNVWLNFIPVFNLVWVFVTVLRVRDSVRAEYGSRRLSSGGDFGFGVGIAYATLLVFGAVFSAIPTDEHSFTPVDGISSGITIALLVCFIVYWVKCSRLKDELLRTGPAFRQVNAPQYPAYGGYPAQYGAPVWQQAPPRACPSCGAAAQPGDVFCRSCGSRTEVAPVAGAGPAPAGGPAAAEASGTPAATCPFCGAAYRPNARFCNTCGRPVV
jgi:hypothetical protein